jgi:hypothetical protein
MISSKNMIPLKDMHFRIQMHLSPEQEEKMKHAIMESASRISGESPRSLGPGSRLLSRNHVNSRSLRLVPGAKNAHDLEQAAVQCGDEMTGGSMNFPKPMLNSPTKSSSEVGAEFLQQVLARLEQSSEARQLAKETVHLKDLSK